MDKFIEEDEEGPPRPAPAGLATDELTDWIVTIETSSATTAAHALDRWEKTRSLAWLVAALTTAKGQQPKLDALLTAAAGVSHASPAFPSVAFHHARLLMETKRGDEAQALLDKVLANDRAQMSKSAV